MEMEKDYSTMDVDELKAVKAELEKSIEDGNNFLNTCGATNLWRKNVEFVMDEEKIELQHVNNLLNYL